VSHNCKEEGFHIYQLSSQVILEEVEMYKTFLLSLMFFFIMPLCGWNALTAEKPAPGEQPFMKNCGVCHTGGGNIINPAKTLKSKDMTANGIRKPADIVKNMRDPGPGMTHFDEKTIPDQEAKEIAEYILKTFK
jgi:cytochrome c6